MERADFARVIVQDSFKLSRLENGRKLFVEEPADFGAGVSEEGQSLLRTVMLGHILAGDFPKVVETNFPVTHKSFLDRLYKHYGFPKATIVRSSDQVKPVIKSPEFRADKTIPVASAHSGGLDSAYRLINLLDQGQSPLVVHLQNLNPKGNAWESAASELQAQTLGVEYARVKLKNNSGNTGFTAMRTRDMLLALIAGIKAMPYGVATVQIEGGMQTTSDAHFSEYVPAWQFFNNLLAESDMPLQIEGVDPGDIESIGAIIKLEKKLGIRILPLVQNCFCAPYQLPNSRRKWQRETPQLAGVSPDHWCGSCLKCRRMTLGRLSYQDPDFGVVPKQEIEYFVKDTHAWLKKYTHNSDLISASFLSHLEKLSLTR